MNKPSAELLTETFTIHSGLKGYHLLRDQGYDVSRRECRKVRERLIAEKAVKTRATYNDSIVDRVRAMAADGASTRKIAKELDSTTRQIYDLCRRHSIVTPPDYGAECAPPPDRDKLDAVFQVNSIAKSAEIFDVSINTMKRWIAAHGLKRVEKIKPERRVYQMRATKRPFGRQWTTAAIPAAEHSAANDAATYLRQQGYSNVYRRNRSEWQVGGRVMAEKDMLARVVEIKARRARMMGGVM